MFLIHSKLVMLRIHVGKFLVQVNSHYYYLEDLINTLSLVTQELHCNCSGCLPCYK